MKKAAVIGAGIAGLAGASRLAAKGYAVTVFEAGSQPGGKAGERQLGSFRFDTGPSLCTLPEWIDEVYIHAGRNPRAYWNYQKLERSAVYYFADGSRFDAWADRGRFLQTAAEVFDVDAESLEHYLSHSANLFKNAGSLFLKKSLHSADTWLNAKSIATLMRTSPSDLLTTLHNVNRKRLRNPKLVQLFDRYATYNGSNPYQTPGIMSVIPHLELSVGSYLPDGGIYSIVNGLYRLCLDQGVQFRFDTYAERILIENDKACGVQTASERHAADVVLCTMDVHHAYPKLLPGLKAPKAMKKQQASSSGIVFYWGMKGSFPELDLHNLFFSSDYEKEFRQIFEEKTIPDDPTVYVNITSKYVQHDAPEGMENWFVMVNVPAGEFQHLDAWRMKLKSVILKKLSAILKTNLSERIVEEDYLDPQRLETNTHAWQGAIYGSSSNSMWSAFLRHPNVHPRVGGLYFAGGTVHPGGGIPLCLSSAGIACEKIPSA